MAFQKDGGFGGGQGGNKKSFGGKKPFSQGGQKELFDAVCATCGKACQVPFKPSGDRPVYCRDCFGGKKDAPRDGARNFEVRGAAPMRLPNTPKSQGDVRFEEFKRQIDAVHNKLDVIVKMIEDLSQRKTATKVDKPAKKVAKSKAKKK